MLAEHENFKYRHIGTTAAEQTEMLQYLGFSSIKELMDAAIPDSIRFESGKRLPEAVSETEALNKLRGLASQNRITKSKIGIGYYGTITPGVIKRNVLENPSWYTAYTPYQAEISQGRLEALINFQTMVTDLTGMTTANASMLDEGTSVAEAMLLASRNADNDSRVFYVDQDLFPQTKYLLEHRAEPLDITIKYFNAANGAKELTEEFFGVVVQYPGASGRIVELDGIFAVAHEKGALGIAAADLMALTLIKPPGEQGADIVVGSTQRFGVPMGFGGPHAGYLAVREGLERSMPGRLVGVSVDAEGSPAYRLTLQTREQHIRREKATSNICTAQVLLAVMASMYAVYHGPEGLKAIATDIHNKTVALAEALRSEGFNLAHDSFFDTLIITDTDANKYFEKARNKDFTLRVIDEKTIGISIDEATSWQELNELAEIFGASTTESSETSLGGFERETDYLTHPVFNQYHSETAMLRYLKKLSDYDYALDRGMIPLGSCTMKLNSVTEMEAVTWPEFANLHPFAPKEDVAGYLTAIEQLSDWLCDITGYDAVSLQPNAGSQGELAGMLAIRGYHLSRGDTQRKVCLIPSSAHGTNGASAVLAGFNVTVVGCDEDGNVDLAELKTKIAEAGDQLGAIMITYPSTHGVYEHDVREVCELVHAGGGQVYIDGANTNAVVGYAKFGEFGGDVSHLNLHKTFCIPHGGGGPGVGPVVARAHLAEFLPGHQMSQVELTNQGPVSAAPFGSPSILPISWAYVHMMGEQGLQDATANAVLNANYVARKISNHFPLLYTGDNGMVAHEAIIDIRDINKETGITVDDVAKRLIDYGFHAPTMSFPVNGTLMIEPTESEPKQELDRFISAMIAIREEIDKVSNEEWPRDNNPLFNAPHTAKQMAGEWNHPYSRDTGCFPVQNQERQKYWAPVRRINNVFGDRNLVCTCPPIESYSQ
jgi:glycine dehydrogenase